MHYQHFLQSLTTSDHHGWWECKRIVWNNPCLVFRDTCPSVDIVPVGRALSVIIGNFAAGRLNLTATGLLVHPLLF